jgi:hypothetical protein
MDYSLRNALDGLISTGLMEKSVMVTYYDAKNDPANKPYRLPEDSVHLLNASIELYNKWVMDEIETPAMRSAAAVVAAHVIYDNRWCDHPRPVDGILLWIESQP